MTYICKSCYLIYRLTNVSHKKGKGVIIIIGLEKVINIFNFNANQIAKEIGVSRQTVYDWLKEKRKIPKERIEQLSKIPEFRYINKGILQKFIDEVDEIDIEIARSKYLSDRDSKEIEDEFYGVPVIHDPYAEDRLMLFKLRERVQEIERANSLIFNENYQGDLNFTNSEKYLSALTNLNNIFEQNDSKKINIIVDLFSLLNCGLTNEAVKDLREILQDQNIKEKDGENNT